ncbi:hypothetical protein [Halorubrum sp. PV6]|uniref:hypothetical protein n=1 Tax=Halorubrum sp. PV6 TaxID=634157 RepID=UPI000F855ADD|nr:hypothetical protein [Halorubrum sp. PV6]AZQ14639.1 hypothetical protein DOS48_07220 [Halorubrum sp. PV6]
MTDDESPASAGPDRLRSIAVHRDDVATALEATLRSDREVVLRVTPPFSGRMRARLHSVGPASGSGPASESGSGAASESEPTAEHEGGAESGSTAEPSPLHVDPQSLVADAPPYPEVDQTAADHPDTDVDTRRERHTEAVEAWRTAVRGSVVDTVSIEAGDGESIDVDVTALG